MIRRLMHGKGGFFTLGLLASSVLVFGATPGVGLLALERFAELALGLILGFFGHDGSLTRGDAARRVLYLMPGGSPYRWVMGMVSTTRRS